MQIQKAVEANLEQIMDIVRATIEEMHSAGNYQWDDDYPSAQDFLKDITSGSLYVSREDNLLTGFLCVDSFEPEDYQDIPWSEREPAFMLHRLAIRQEYRKKGHAYQLMQFAEEVAVRNNVRYLKADTSCLNVKMQKLFQRLEYSYVGSSDFLGIGQPFYYYEKVLR